MVGLERNGRSRRRSRVEDHGGRGGGFGSLLVDIDKGLVNHLGALLRILPAHVILHSGEVGDPRLERLGKKSWPVGALVGY